MGKICAWTCTFALMSLNLANLAGKRHNSSPPLTPFTPNPFIFMQKCYIQGWVIRRRRILRRIVFITYISVFFELLRIIRFWALNEFCSHKPPRAPQKHSQALKSPTEALPSPLEPPRGTPSPSERSMITCLLLPQPRRWCL